MGDRHCPDFYHKYKWFELILFSCIFVKNFHLHSNKNMLRPANIKYNPHMTLHEQFNFLSNLAVKLIKTKKKTQLSLQWCYFKDSCYHLYQNAVPWCILSLLGPAGLSQKSYSATHRTNCNQIPRRLRPQVGQTFVPLMSQKWEIKYYI